MFLYLLYFPGAQTTLLCGSLHNDELQPTFVHCLVILFLTLLLIFSFPFEDDEDSSV